MADTREKDGVPVLHGFPERHARGTSLRVWCLWCCDWHIHGQGGDPVGTFTHRIAHCWAPDSAYKRGGYWIEITDTAYSAVKSTVRTATRAQQRALCDGRISDAVRRLRTQLVSRP